MDITRKRLTLVLIEKNSNKNIDLRQGYCRNINTIPDQCLVFLDEIGFNIHTKKKYGYSIKNTKCYVSVLVNRGKNISLMAAITINGVERFELVEGAYDGNMFMNFINIHLKTYFEANTRHILVMDNCAFHHRRDVIELLNSLSISHCFVPPHSPQLNPMEEYFSCLKANYTSARAAPQNKNVLKDRCAL